MARHPRTENETALRRELLALGRLLSSGTGELVVIVARGDVVTVRQSAGAVVVPEGTSTYDASILRALTTRPMTAARLARASGHPIGSYFRSRLVALIDAGHIRHTSRGYRRPPGD
jgi:hypothetical protein